MPQKSPRKGQSEQGLPPDLDINSARFEMEKQMRNIQKLAEKHGFKSVEEVNAFLKKSKAEGKEIEWEPETPLDRAQDMIYSAYKTPDSRERVKIARKALELCPDCADAYVILAENTDSAEKASPLYQSGVEAGERTLGERAFKEDAGEFWKIIETRPYMRARFGLAQCLWWQGKREESIQHCKEMLRLNPDDNQGVRDLLFPALLETGKTAEAKKLLDQYKDEYSAFWLYNQALTAYLLNKDSPQGRKILIKAFDINPYIPAYFLGVKKFPKKPPLTYTSGHEDEAIWYFINFGKIWLDTDATTWLADVVFDELEKYTNLLDSRKILKPILRVFLEEFGKAQKKGKAAKVPDAFLRAFESDDKAPKNSAKETNIYTFKVTIKGMRSVWRKIEIKGSQTLDDLHHAIYKAFDRYDPHLYAFFMSNKAWDQASEYSLPESGTNRRDATHTRIDSLGLTLKQKFLYIFDFGDCWAHTITLAGVGQEKTEGEYPRIIESKGESPPQYPDYDEDSDYE